MYCSKHRQLLKCNELIFTCDDCDDVMICSECATTAHKGHSFTDLEVTARKRIKTVQEFNSRGEYKMPRIEQIISDADEEIVRFEDEIQKQIGKAHERRTCLKTEIDLIANETEDELRNELHTYKKKHSAFKKDSFKTVRKIKDIIELNCEAINSRNTMSILERSNTSSGLRVDMPSYRCSSLPLVKFSRGPNANVVMRDNFGVVTYSPVDDIKAARVSARTQRPTISNEPKHKPLKEPQMKLRLYSSIEKQTELAFNPTKVAVSHTGTVYVIECTAKQLFRMNGRMTPKPIMVGSSVIHMCMHPVNNLLYCIIRCVKNTFVSYIDADKDSDLVTKLFYVDRESNCLAITKNDDIVVVGRNKPFIAIYAHTGNILKSIDTAADNIATCPLTGKFAVYPNGSAVVIMNEDFVELYRYKGEPFRDCHDVVFDRHGHILVTEDRHQRSNKVIALNAENAQHIKNITTNSMGRPKALAITNNDKLIVCIDRNLVIMKYLE